MNRSDAIAEVKSRYAEYLQPAKKKGYICPLCQNGTGSDGDGLVVNPHGDGTQLKCFKCDFSGDIIDLYEKSHNDCGFIEALDALCAHFGIVIDDNSPQIAATRGEDPQPADAPEILTEKKDFTEYYKQCKADLSDPDALTYLKARGISEGTAAAFWIGYDKIKKLLIIPVSRSFYVARTTDSTAKMRYINPSDVSVELFNVNELYNDNGRPVFVTEAAIDALSIIEAGGAAIALNGVGNVRKLIGKIEAKRPDKTLILALDNDDAGRKATSALAEGLKDHNIPYVIGEICGDHKDPNEALTNDAEAFRRSVTAAERGTNKPDNVADYMRRFMASEIEALKAQGGRKTGFQNLDTNAGNIYAGLYIVGGISSVGKTTFMSQIADQMAEQGQHVLYFSMEQSRLEMVSKGISRLTAKADPEKAVNSLQIRTGAKGESISAATSEYLRNVGDRLSIIEGNASCTVSMIREYARQYSKQNGGVKPVIIVDYLQVLQAEKDPDTGRKMTDPRQIVDHNLTELRRLCREGMPVFAISSINRGNYLSPIDFEAFKESGGIEFTADVIWGLQLAALNDRLFENDKKTVEKRKLIADAKEAIPRDIELICLKNRFGKTRYTARFTYYPQYDYFAPTADKWPPDDNI